MALLSGPAAPPRIAAVWRSVAVNQVACCCACQQNKVRLDLVEQQHHPHQRHAHTYARAQPHFFQRRHSTFTSLHHDRIHRHTASAPPSTPATTAVTMLNTRSISNQATNSASCGASATAFVFPGQGAQKLGMTMNELDLPRVQRMYDEAREILGYDIKEIVMGDSQEKLDSTAVCQPAMLIAGLAALERLRIDNPDAVAACKAAAGLSLGEYTALVAGGALSFQHALRIVKIRGEMMLKASEQNKGTMLSVIGVDDALLSAACKEAASSLNQTADIGNFLSPGIRVVSGDAEAVEAVRTRVEGDALKVQYLPVSGAFHTPLMQPAVDALAAALDQVEIKMPIMDVYANTLGRPYRSVAEIKEQLVVQVASPVMWEDTLRDLARTGSDVFELGPQRQIKSMMRKVSMPAFKKMKNIAV